MKQQNSGKSIRIRVAEPSDADWLAETWSNREFVELYCSNIQPPSAESLHETLAARQETPAETLGFIEFIVERLNGERIGICSLGSYAAQHRRAELMIGIVDPALRRGTIGLEATLLLLDLAFNNYQLNKIFTYVYAYNEFSESNTIKLGFIQEGILRQHHWSATENRFIDLYINGMTLGDFRQADHLARWSRRLLGWDITQSPTVCKPSTELPLDGGTQASLIKALSVFQNAD